MKGKKMKVQLKLKCTVKAAPWKKKKKKKGGGKRQQRSRLFSFFFFFFASKLEHVSPLFALSKQRSQYSLTRALFCSLSVSYYFAFKELAFYLSSIHVSHHKWSCSAFVLFF